MKLLILIFSLVIGGAALGSIFGGGAWNNARNSGRGGGFAAPELDPGTAGSAMVLVLGGVAYFTSRRRDESAI